MCRFGRVVEIELRRVFFVFYVLIPVVFYGVPWLISIPHGGISMHFFQTFFISSSELLEILVGHLILGGVVYLVLKNIRNYKIYVRAQSVASDIALLVFYALSFMVDIGYIKVFLFPIVLIIMASRWPYGATFLGLLLISAFQLVLNEDRYPVIMTLLLWGAPILSRLSYKLLLISGATAIFGLIFVLQPLRAGIMPFINDKGLGELSYFFLHLQPIYIGAYLSNTIEFSNTTLLGETTPFLKSILGMESAIEIVAKEGLPIDVIESGTRHGSNSSMYFSVFGAVVLAFGLSLIYLLSEFFRLRVFANVALLYFFVQGPYFIRRSFGLFVIDFMVLTVLAVLFCSLLQFISYSTKGKPG